MKRSVTMKIKTLRWIENWLFDLGTGVYEFGRWLEELADRLQHVHLVR